MPRIQMTMPSRLIIAILRYRILRTSIAVNAIRRISIIARTSIVANVGHSGLSFYKTKPGN